MLEQRIQQQFFDSADLKYAAAEILAKPISDAVGAVVGCITSGGKVLACGNGGSAGDASTSPPSWSAASSASAPACAAMALTTDTSILTAVGNDYGFDAIFSEAGAGARPARRRAAGDQHQRQLGQRAGRGEAAA